MQFYIETTSTENNNGVFIKISCRDGKFLESSLVENKIPYKIKNGTDILSREIVLDIIAYLICIFNPKDNISFQRIINKPKRGIGIY